MGRNPFDQEVIRKAYDEVGGKTRTEKTRLTAARIGCSVPTVVRAINARKNSGSASGPASMSHRKAAILPIDNAATLEHRTQFPTMTFPVRRGEWLLKAGEHSAKIGAKVTKGPWKGFPIYTLTLEERATCPTSCRSWNSCYGNNTPFARRWHHGPALEDELKLEVAQLQRDHPRGFAVRLHNLGDFYSVAYVEIWRDLLSRHPALHVFGYTARIDTMDDEIAYAVAVLVRDYWVRANPPRFAVRFSNAPVFARSTLTMESPVQKPKDVIICPAQYTPSGKKAEGCASCALCWGTTRRVGFLQH